MFTLTVWNGSWGKMASNLSLYLGSSLSNMLSQKLSSKSMSDPLESGSCTNYLSWFVKVIVGETLFVVFS